MAADRSARRDSLPTFRFLARQVLLAPAFVYHLPRAIFHSMAGRGEMAFVCRQMAVFLRSNHDLAGALLGLSGEIHNGRLRAAVAGVAERVEAGMALSAAMVQQGGVFDRDFVATVEAGEKSGKLPDALEILAERRTRVSDTFASLEDAMVYPAILVLIAVFLSVFASVKLFPQIAEMFESCGGELPAPTILAAGLADAAISGWFFWLPVFAALLAGFVVLRYWRHDLGERFLLRVPVLRTMLKLSHLGRFASVLDMLVRSGAPLVEALRSGAAAAGPGYRREVLNVADRVERGGSLGDAFKENGRFPPFFEWHIRSAEATGDLGKGLAEADETCRLKAKHYADIVPIVVENGVIILAGAWVALLVVATMLPLFEVSQVAGG